MQLPLLLHLLTITGVQLRHTPEHFQALFLAGMSLYRATAVIFTVSASFVSKLGMLAPRVCPFHQWPPGNSVSLCTPHQRMRDSEPVISAFPACTAHRRHVRRHLVYEPGPSLAQTCFLHHPTIIRAAQAVINTATVRPRPVSLYLESVDRQYCSP